MRTERPEPWGFDVWDPRLTMRQQAADAQRVTEINVPDIDEEAAQDEPASNEPLAAEPVGGRRG